MKPGKTMNDSAHGIPDTNMKLDEEGGPHKHPDQVLEQPEYVGETLLRRPPLLSCLMPLFILASSVLLPMPSTDWP